MRIQWEPYIGIGKPEPLKGAINRKTFTHLQAKTGGVSSARSFLKY